MTAFPERSLFLPLGVLFHAGIRALPLAVALCAILGGTMQGAAERKQPAPSPAPDLLVLSNGDTLHGKFVSEVGGKVTFHCDPLGDITLGWNKIRELHATQKFAVLNKNVKPGRRKDAGTIPTGSFDVVNQTVTLHPAASSAPMWPLPVKDAQFIVDEATLNKQVNHVPGFFSGWNGAATAGATLVSATQNQYTVSGGIRLVRTVPTVSWLESRNRMSANFSGSFGKITQPGYYSAGTYVPEVATKSSISHLDAERDEYFSPRFFALAQTAFDHNFGQKLNLQQIYGGGIGWTAVKNQKQEVDVKGSIQYEKQKFINGATGTNQNLVGSTFSVNYMLRLKRLTYTQSVAYIPAFNQTAAYSANERNSFAFPAYKNLSFSLGTTDSYLNDPPVSLPPTMSNSFQFTMGLTYAIKSKY
ncbi:MAG: DUF481 domain-containing protein [Terracidiphilus sp.]|nr:DUF481 domain-containing protein [Terracidiphilus sp.]